MPNQPVPATDSAAELHKLIGDDVTATFESDPTFVDSNPTASASSDNLEEQRPGAGAAFQAASGKGAGPDPDEEDEFADEDDDLEDDDEDDEDDDLEDDDEDDVDDEEDDEDFEDDDEEEDDEEDDDEEDADELKASASSPAPVLRADGLLGYEDEAEDANKGVDRVTGDVDRRREEARELAGDPDEDTNDINAEVNPEEEREERSDSDVFIPPVKPMDLASAAFEVHIAFQTAAQIACHACAR